MGQGKVKKRRSIKKTERVLIAARTNHRCSYCGCELGDSFHIDHKDPIHNGGTCDESNLLATCAPCNLLKSVLSLEQFRREISYQAERAHRYSVNFRTALRFKQVKVQRSDIVFYFETLTGEDNEQKEG